MSGLGLFFVKCSTWNSDKEDGIVHFMHFCVIYTKKAIFNGICVMGSKIVPRGTMWNVYIRTLSFMSCILSCCF